MVKFKPLFTAVKLFAAVAIIILAVSWWMVPENSFVASNTFMAIFTLLCLALGLSVFATTLVDGSANRRNALAEAEVR